MTTEHAIEIVAVVNFVVVGLSHIAQPKVWVEFFVMLRARGHPGVFVNGMDGAWEFQAVGVVFLVISAAIAWGWRAG